jgi:hypothetical protein
MSGTSSRPAIASADSRVDLTHAARSQVGFGAVSSPPRLAASRSTRLERHHVEPKAAVGNARSRPLQDSATFADPPPDNQRPRVEKQQRAPWRAAHAGARNNRSPAEQRSTRSRPCLHGSNAARHYGHPRRPPTNSAWTSACSVHTINMGATSGIQRALLTHRQERREGSRASTNARSLPPPRASSPR